MGRETNVNHYLIAATFEIMPAVYVMDGLIFILVQTQVSRYNLDDSIYVAMQQQVEQRIRHISLIQRKTVLGMASMVENRDNNTGGHIKRTSAEIVEKILRGVEEEHFVNVAVNVARYHHEKWNGQCYPLGLEQVFIMSRDKMEAYYKNIEVGEC